MFEDYHTHTEFSDDSVYDMEQCVRDAVAMGMDEICFTDHVDYGIKKDWDACTPQQLAAALKTTDGPLNSSQDPVILNVNYPAYFEKIRTLQDRYGEKIRIRTGMEFGIQSHTIDAFQHLFDRYRDQWDFILLSIHQVNDQEFWTQDFQRGHSQEEYNRAYYEELLECVRSYKDYSVLGHMDLICRYDLQGVFPFERCRDLITEILRQVIADGKGIEINTSSVRYGLQDLCPSRDILKLYRELGGTILTFGSDSHCPEHLGKYIQEQKQLVRDLGFKEYCTFERMKPVFHPL